MEDNDFISDYEMYGGVFDFVFLNEFFINETENNTTENKIDHDSLLACNASASHTLDVVKHFDDSQPLQHDSKGETTRWIRRRRFKKDTEEYTLWRRETRLKNRISARKSIEKKQAHIRELEAEVIKLKAKIKLRKKIIQFFPNSKPGARLSGLRRTFSMSDFYAPTQVAAEKPKTIGKPVGCRQMPPPIMEHFSKFS